MIKPIFYSVILVLLSNTFLQASSTRPLTQDTITQQNNNDDYRDLYADTQPYRYLDYSVMTPEFTPAPPERIHLYQYSAPLSIGRYLFDYDAAYFDHHQQYLAMISRYGSQVRSVNPETTQIPSFQEIWASVTRSTNSEITQTTAEFTQTNVPRNND